MTATIKGTSKAAARRRTTFACTECGTTAAKWAGRCDGCGEWNTIVEEVVSPSTVAPLTILATPATPIGEVPMVGADPIPTGIDELDRVLSGGILPGSVTLVGGE